MDILLVEPASRRGGTLCLAVQINFGTNYPDSASTQSKHSPSCGEAREPSANFTARAPHPVSSMQQFAQTFPATSLRRCVVPLLAASSLGFIASARGDPGEGGAWKSDAHAPEIAGIEANPLKGMIPFESGTRRSFPHSMEWFYLPLRDLQKGDSEFDWEPIERRLEKIAGRGNHSVFRIYLDYPGKPIGTPQYLIDAGVPMRGYTDAGNHHSASKSPDWNDPRLIGALESFILHLGKKYDGDPRIGFLTAGLYGFWGEWHNHPHDPGWEMRAEGRDRLLNAYRQAFAKTHVLLRNPMGTTNPGLKTSFGYHDDSFGYETLRPEWAFFPRLHQNGLVEIWKQKPIGGEIRPELQATIFDAWPNLPVIVGSKASEDLSECINATHASWMLNERLFAGSLTDIQRKNALRAQRLLGYELHVAGSSIDRDEKNNLHVRLKIRNAGVAPFYYEWPAEFASFDPATKMKRVLGRSTNWNVPDILPDGREYQREFSCTLTESTRGRRLLLRLVNPLENGKPLRFANARQDGDLEGWLTLQDIPDEITGSTTR
ncbi:DUF4832 domain-containing protein [Luteolibacter arcticus]|uniref:DUF4832 domain-containing protein n=1 Tax=Luteolibacter arcticus TaxID=1581411 RepID=A0ABT3GKN3_9BACT|nr:DUF4832 domain-containing protein [Luteolibacter arcticus]MCW1924050.1 DUF4832 domain-containing protein [Luteolibacter arcticus]